MKIRVGVLYGGKTTEHEVSIITAVQAMEHLNKDKYDIVPMYLTKEMKCIQVHLLRKRMYIRNQIY